MRQTAVPQMSNPFREDLVSRSRPQPCTVVIFGATGDLTHRKLIPALYNLAVDGELPPGVKILGFARRDKSDEESSYSASKNSNSPRDGLGFGRSATGSRHSALARLFHGHKEYSSMRMLSW